MRSRPANTQWVLFAVAIAGMAVASVAVAAVQARSTGCIFDDGHAYCRMAQGRLAELPFSHRVVVPALVSWLPSGLALVVRFKILSIFGASAAVVGTGLLTFRLLRERGSAKALPAAIIAAALVALSPHLFRLAFTAPVLADQMSIFLGLLWCLLVTSRADWARWLSPFLVLILIPAREAWILPLLLAALVMAWMRARALAAATVAAVLAGSIFTFTRPSAPGRYSAWLEAGHWTHLAVVHPGRTAWTIFFGVGLVSGLGLVLLAYRSWLRGPLGIILAVACGHLVQALVAGADHSRLAAAALPYGVVLAVVTTAAVGGNRAFWALAALAAVTVAIFEPFSVASPSVAGYASMYYDTPSSTLIALGGFALLGAALWWVLRDVRSTRDDSAARISRPEQILGYPRG